MKFNSSISTLEILEKYPYAKTLIGIEDLTLECINEALMNDMGIKLKTFDINSDLIHVYNNCIILFVALDGEITMYVFYQREKVSDEVTFARRKLFFDSLEPLN